MNRSPVSLEALEARALLAAVAFTDALVVNAVDHDADGHLRAFDMQWIVNATGSGSVSYYVDVEAVPVAGGTPELILRSAVEAISGGQSRTTSYTLRSDLFGVPQNFADPREHFKLYLVDLTNDTVAPLQDVDLADISMEQASADVGTGDVAPLITSFSATPNGTGNALIADSAVRFDIVTSSSVAIDSVMVFFDRAGNSMVDPTDLFGQDGSKRTTFKLAAPHGADWAADFAVDPDWTSGTIAWGAIAVDVNGNVSAVATVTTVVRQAPVVNGGSVSVLRGINGYIPLTDAAQWFQPQYSNYYGEAMQFHPSIDRFASLAHVYYILDADHSGGWTTGDQLLGEGDPLRNFDFYFVLDPHWGNPQPSASIIIDAVDVYNVWARQRGTMTFQVTDRPVVTAAAAPPTAGAGQVMHLTATVSDYSPRAVTWFIDRLANFRFDPGTDIDLGASFSNNGGTFSRDVVVDPSWAGRSVIMADAVDTAGAWSGPLAMGATWISAGPIVAAVSLTSPGPVLVAGQSVTLTAAVSAGIVLDGVTFFADRDRDGAFTPGVDRDLGADRDSSGGWSLTFTVPNDWSLTALKFGANAFRGSTFGAFSTVTAQSYSYSAGPLVGLVVAPASVTWGEQFTVSAQNITGIGVRAVTFFFDVAGNGVWNAGVDTDLGADFDGTNGWSVSATARSWWAPGTAGRIVAHAVDTNGNWGYTTTSSSAVTVYDRPTISNLAITPSVTNPDLSVPFGTSFSITADIAASAGVRAVTFFVDIDHNGAWTPGVDRDLGATFFPGNPPTVGGGLSSLFNWGHGTFTILADALDTRDRWSLVRPSITVTIA